jgi:hypothetical protein
LQCVSFCDGIEFSHPRFDVIQLNCLLRVIENTIRSSHAGGGRRSRVDQHLKQEAHGGGAYWSAWRGIPISFPKGDLARVPEHWRFFRTRTSAITGKNRSAADPVNAMLNYLYAVLESETRLAAAALGLDPGFGLLHADAPARDSLVYDPMEPVRSKVDAYVLDWITRTPLKRSWFFEQRDGTCRLMGEFDMQLSETALTWSREVAPLAEWFAQTLCSNAAFGPGTRLTNRRKRGDDGLEISATQAAKQQPKLCELCGEPTTDSRSAHCEVCIPLREPKIWRIDGWESSRPKRRRASKNRRRG